jgi:hypothetical protein
LKMRPIDLTQDEFWTPSNDGKNIRHGTCVTALYSVKFKGRLSSDFHLYAYIITLAKSKAQPSLLSTAYRHTYAALKEQFYNQSQKQTIENNFMFG